MNKLKVNNAMLIVLFVMNTVCVAANLRNGGNAIMLALNAFTGGAILSALIFDHLHKKAMKLCNDYAKLARSALSQSTQIMEQQIDRYKTGIRQERKITMAETENTKQYEQWIVWLGKTGIYRQCPSCKATRVYNPWDWDHKKYMEPHECPNCGTKMLGYDRRD